MSELLGKQVFGCSGGGKPHLTVKVSTDTVRGPRCM